MNVIALTTDSLPINIVLFLLGLLVLIKGSDWFVDGAAHIARHFRIAEIVIGLTLVSIGTSLPELATDVYASFMKEGDIAIGDIVGSNITNICLVLGVGVVLMGTISVSRQVLKRDASIMLGVFVLFIAFCAFGGNESFELSRMEGGILLLLVGAYTFYLFRHPDSLEEESVEPEDNPPFKTMTGAWIFLILGIVLVFSGAKVLVDNVVKTAQDMNLNKALIAATIVAFGTSVPELAVTITSVVKKRNNIALGNIIGSCIFNLLLVMGVSALVNPIPVSKEIMTVILPLMFISGVLLLVFMRTKWKLERWEGYLFIVMYLMFIGYNVAKIRM